MARYILEGDDGGEYSADPADYWYLPAHEYVGGALVRVDHPYRTTTGRVIEAPRLLKSDATMRDLPRVSSFVQRAMARTLPAKELSR